MLGGSSAPGGGSRQWSPRRAGRWEEEGDCGTRAPSDPREVGLGGEVSLPVGALQGAADTRFLRVFVPGKEGVLCVSLGKPKLEAGCPAFPEGSICPERRGAAEFSLPHRDVHFSGTQGVLCPARWGWWPFLPTHSSSREDRHSLDATHLLVYVRTRGTFISLYLDVPGFSVGGTSFTHSSHFTAVAVAVAVLQVWDQQHQQHLNLLERQVPSPPQTYGTRYSENWSPTTCLRNFRF